MQGGGRARLSVMGTGDWYTLVSCGQEVVRREATEPASTRSPEQLLAWCLHSRTDGFVTPVHLGDGGGRAPVGMCVDPTDFNGRGSIKGVKGERKGSVAKGIYPPNVPQKAGK